MSDLPTPGIATSRNPGSARLKVEPSTEGFWKGMDYRISEEIFVDATPLVFRFESTKDFILRNQVIESDAGAMRFRVYRAAQGVEGGTFDNDIPIYKVNFITGVPSVDTGVNITTGGSFTPAALPLGKAVEVIRVKSSTQSNRQITISGDIGTERGLPPGIYYIVIDRFTGSGTSEGVVAVQWEELEPQV